MGRADYRAVRDDRGMALTLALFALVIIGGMVAGGFFAAVLEQQSSRNTLYLSQAAEAAEAQLPVALSGVPVSTLATLPVGGTPRDLGSIRMSAELSVERQVARLTDSLFLLRTSASRVDADGVALATRAIGLILKLAIDSVSGSDTVLPLSRRAWVQLY
jgi:hypothetical protein